MTVKPKALNTVYGQLYMLILYLFELGGFLKGINLDIKALKRFLS